MKIIGRHKEQELLAKIKNSKKAEFVALYGRRRVGKTFLVRESFRNEDCLFCSVAGLKDGSMQDQLSLFYQGLTEAFGAHLNSEDIPQDWTSAFSNLYASLNNIHKAGKARKVVVFLDELPWLATKGSGLIQALDHAWNTKLSTLSYLKLIVCGSAASWMVENLVQSKGGLHNRLTKVIRLQPFTLDETQQYFKEEGFRHNLHVSLLYYLILGGIPYYLNLLDKSLSLAENVDALFFRAESPLKLEFKRLYSSLFGENEIYVKVVRLLAENFYGLVESQIRDKLKVSSGGTFMSRLVELEEAGFIYSYIPYGGKKKDKCFRLIDEYSRFFLKWVEPTINNAIHGGSVWNSLSRDASCKTWLGFSFENFCFRHIDEIQASLGLANVLVMPGSWKYYDKQKKGAQIDLLIERSDNSINICEIKYGTTPFNLDKKSALEIKEKVSVFMEATKSDRQVFVTLITPHGVKKSIWTEGLIDSVVNLESMVARI